MQHDEKGAEGAEENVELKPVLELPEAMKGVHPLPKRIYANPNDHHHASHDPHTVTHQAGRLIQVVKLGIGAFLQGEAIILVAAIPGGARYRQPDQGQRGQIDALARKEGRGSYRGMDEFFRL
ncbi:hypothetical protein [Rhodocaloribacter sp.]